MRDTLLNLKILLAFWDIIRRKDFMLGRTVQEIETKLADFCGAKYAFGVASGTDALILSLKTCDIGPGDEVIVPALSFFSTAGAVTWINAKPVFVDVEKGSFNIDPAKIEEALTPRTKAIIAVHLNGRMADMEKISAIAKKHGLFLIEDAAQAIGSKYKEKSPGYYSDLACFSFNPTKILGGYGDGGAIVTNSLEIGRKVASLRIYGANSLQELNINHKVVGTASRLDPFQAVVLKTKLETLKKTIEQWRKNYFLYNELLRGTSDLQLPIEPNECFIPTPSRIPPGLLRPHQNLVWGFINGYRYAILTEQRNKLLDFLRTNEIDARSHYPVPLPYFEAFKQLGYKKGDFPVAEKIAEKIIVLPNNESLPLGEIVRVCNSIKEFFSKS